MSWRQVTAIVWLGFALGALTDTALRWRAEKSNAGAAFRRSGNDEAVPPSSVPDVETTLRRPSDAERPPASSEARATATTGISAESAIDVLRHRDLEIPVEGIHRKDLRDTFSETREGTRPHEALDIIAARGTPVRAVDDGTIRKLFNSKAGGLTIYQFDPSETFSYYYAHLDAYASGVREGQRVRKDDVIGYVGSTGNASPQAPHLHFAIFRLTPERQWWKGEPVNPYGVFR
jgi:murein DD-endopeptidase MepM/ murein hydrolase activator NlpD